MKLLAKKWLLWLYIAFTVICWSVSLVFSEWSALQIWYCVTAAVWIMLAVAAIILLNRLRRLNKLKEETKRQKE